MPNELEVGELLGHLLQILENSQKRIDELCEFLYALHDTLLTPSAVKSIIADNRNHLLFDLLQRLNVVTNKSDNSGHVISQRIPWLQQHLYLVLGAYSASKRVVPDPPSLELAWTLPDKFSKTNLTEPVSRSLASLIIYGITRAKKELFLVSPFLDFPGAELLAGSIQGAYRRGGASLFDFPWSESKYRGDDIGLQKGRSEYSNILCTYYRIRREVSLITRKTCYCRSRVCGARKCKPD